MLSHLRTGPASGKAYKADGTVEELSGLLQRLVLDTESNEALLAGEVVEWDGQALVARVEVPLRDGAIRPVLVAVDNAPTEGYLPGQTKDLAVNFEFLVGPELYEAQAVIGTGADGQVVIEVLVPGPGGLAYSVLVDADLAEQDRALSAVLEGTVLTVSLATESFSAAGALIGSGANGQVDIETAAPGTEGNAPSIEVNASLATQDRPLRAAAAAGAITLELATEGDQQATARIGDCDENNIDILVDAPGAVGNGHTVEVVVAVDNDRAMSAAIVGTDITVTLGTDGAGAPDPAKNIAELVATAITALAGVTANTPGAGPHPLTAAEVQKSFTGGTNKLHTDANAAALAAAEIALLAGYGATASGTGADSLAAAEGPTQFTGGANRLAAAANTAALVAGAVNLIAEFNAVASGAGTSPLTAAEGPTQFEGGANAAKTWMPWRDAAGSAIGFTAAGSTRRVCGPFTGWPLFSGGRLVLTAGNPPEAGSRTVVYVRTA